MMSSSSLDLRPRSSFRYAGFSQGPRPPKWLTVAVQATAPVADACTLTEEKPTISCDVATSTVPMVRAIGTQTKTVGPQHGGVDGNRLTADQERDRVEKLQAEYAEQLAAEQEKSWRLSRELFEAQATHSTTEQMLGALQSENEELLARHEQLSGVEARVGILEAELAAARRNEEFAREEAQAARNEAELCREASVSRGDETSYLATELASVKGERDKFAEDAALRADEQQRRIAELQAIVQRLELTRDDLQESLTKERAVTLSYMEESDRQTTRIEQLEAEVAAAPPPGVVREAAHWKQAAGEHLRFRELLLSQMDTYVVQQAQAQRQLEQFGVDFLGTNLLGSGPPAGAASDFGEEMSAGGVHGRGFKCAMGTATMPLT